MTKETFDQAIIDTVARYAYYFDIEVINGQPNFEEYVSYVPESGGRVFVGYIEHKKFQELPNEVRLFFKEQLKK